ncbi:MAG: T9SS type A sorting domain-containing protein [Bacteroidota bacterium]
MKLITLLLACMASYSLYAQFGTPTPTGKLLEFNWNSAPNNDRTDTYIPIFGPRGTNAHDRARNITPGANGRGLGQRRRNFGGTRDLDLRVDPTGQAGYGAAYFNSTSVRFTIGHQPEENDCYFFTRGQNMRFGMRGGVCTIQYYVWNAAGTGYQKIGNDAIPTNVAHAGQTLFKFQRAGGQAYTDGDYDNDNTWRVFRFEYNEGLGLGWVDVLDGGVWSTVWTQPVATPGQQLYWGAVNGINPPNYYMIGEIADGRNEGRALFDNALVEMPIVLPVTLSSFEGKSVGTQVHLNWVVSQEIDNNYYTLQRSTDGYEFEEIGQIDGVGTIDQDVSYDFIDEYPVPGKNYYKLFQTDLNGTTRPVGNLVVTLQGESSQFIAAYPNPVKKGQNLNLRFFSPENQFLQVGLYGMQGQEMYQARRTLFAGTQNLEIPTSSLVPGVYLLRVQDGPGTLYTRRIIITD